MEDNLTNTNASGEQEQSNGQGEGVQTVDELQVMIAEQKKIVDDLNRQLRGLQSVNDARYAELQNRLQAELEALQAEREELVGLLEGVIPSEERSAVSAHRQQSQSARQLRMLQAQLDEAEKQAYIATVLAEEGIRRDELPPEAFANRNAFDRAVRLILRERAQASAQRPKATTGTDGETIEDRIARKVLERIGAGAAPAARGVTQTGKRDLEQIVREEGLDAGIASLIKSLSS